MPAALYSPTALMALSWTWTFRNASQLPMLGASHQRLQTLRTIRPRSAARPNGSYHAQAQEAWPPVEDPERRRRRYGESVERMKRASRRRRKEVGKGRTPQRLHAPDNGHLVPNLIPLAHATLEARAVLQQGVERLLGHVPAHVCCECLELSVGATGHPMPTCRGKTCFHRNNRHQWAPATCRDLLLEPESFHLHNRTLPAIYHHSRFEFERIPAVLELCIQGGVDVDHLPVWRKGPESRQVKEEAGGQREEMMAMKRERREMIRGVLGIKLRGDGVVEHGGRQRGPMGDFQVASDDGSQVGNEERAVEQSGAHRMDESDSVGDRESDSDSVEVGEGGDRSVEEGKREVLPPISEDPDLRRVARRTLGAWVEMREGVRRLMKKYSVKTCGYCPEVQVGPMGHKVRLCGASKQQWRGGMHGWHDAHVDDVVLPRYVWHMPDPHVPLLPQLHEYYGMLPAIAEFCVQGGARAPIEFEKMMREDVVLPDVNELKMVA